MGENYYARINGCEHCEKHIGKSSVGWVFTLHVEPDKEGYPSNLLEWVDFICRDDVTVHYEGGTECPKDELFALILKKAVWKGKSNFDEPDRMFPEKDLPHDPLYICDLSTGDFS